MKKVTMSAGRTRRGWQGHIKRDLEEMWSGVRAVLGRVSMGANGRLVVIQWRKLLERQRYFKRMSDYWLLKK